MTSAEIACQAALPPRKLARLEADGFLRVGPSAHRRRARRSEDARRPHRGRTGPAGSGRSTPWPFTSSTPTSCAWRAIRGSSTSSRCVMGPDIVLGVDASAVQAAARWAPGVTGARMARSLPIEPMSLVTLYSPWTTAMPATAACACCRAAMQERPGAARRHPRRRCHAQRARPRASSRRLRVGPSRAARGRVQPAPAVDDSRLRRQSIRSAPRRALPMRFISGSCAAAAGERRQHEPGASTGGGDRAGPMAARAAPVGVPPNRGRRRPARDGDHLATAEHTARQA